MQLTGYSLAIYRSQSLITEETLDEATKLDVDAARCCDGVRWDFADPASSGGSDRENDRGRRYNRSLQDRPSKRLRSGKGVPGHSGPGWRPADNEHSGQHPRSQ